MIAFNKYYNQFNILSISLVVISLFLLTFKGLNFGIDFKGGTLIELRCKYNNIISCDYLIFYGLRSNQRFFTYTWDWNIYNIIFGVFHSEVIDSFVCLQKQRKRGFNLDDCF